MDLSIVIVNWNTCELLKRCLEAAYAATSGLAAEVFVVDNGSTDGSQQLVRERFPAVRLIQNTVNVGFVLANNQAFDLAEGEFVLLLNSDAFLAPDALRTLIDFLRAHPNAGAAGPRLSNADGTLQRSCTAFPTLFDELCLMLQLDRAFPRSPLFAHFWFGGWEHDTVREVDVITGACLLVRRAVISAIGGLDERFFMYSEEVDWCYRIKQAGWQLYLVPDARAIHIGGGSASTVRVEMFIQLFRSRVTFFRKHRGPASALALKGVFGLGSVLRVAAGAPSLLSALLQQRQPHPKLACYWQLLRVLPKL